MHATSIVRSHGSDLYEGIATDYLPYRRFLSSGVGAPNLHVYLAESARQFAEKKFGSSPSIVAPLGIFLDAHESRLEFHLKDKGRLAPPYVFVSASHITKQKRVDLIASVITLLFREGLVSKWVHFGGMQDEISSILETISPKFQSLVDLRGPFVSNEEFRNELEKIGGGVFINLSSTEGMPVSIMEAMASGFAIVATSVGAVPSMITDESGLLLDPSEGPELNADRISLWLRTQDVTSLGFSARTCAERNFSAEKNYIDFANRILLF
jgi:glycosyltransferase involved in cell wall biosynthesis